MLQSPRRVLGYYGTFRMSPWWSACCSPRERCLTLSTLCLCWDMEIRICDALCFLCASLYRCLINSLGWPWHNAIEYYLPCRHK
ncbi:hypothetical protein CY34DRAFT_386004 [Suillus luteus UH-Slu-Lm8-n1]|uniref:Uncharacterized protein n=1 Tax=Suillus luteus UH-Slu-Lm8-n1 TaxID=930992 RepID=A0A0D0A9V9_9AGAM|nr:hypothetical protein CY34DRAFT_386004 [Suillus luteus UH-Slu-Lm8-n1]